MSFRTLTETLDNLYTSTWQNMKSTLIDNIFDASPFYWWLKNNGGIENVEGGRFITEPIRYAKNDVISWIGKGDAVSLNDVEFMTIANYDWRYLVGSLVRFGIDDQQNRGRNQIINFATAKIENMKDSLIDTLETALFQGAGSKTTGVDGLQLLVADDPTAAASPGGIPQNTQTWWRNQTSNLTGVSFATSGVDRMRTLLNNALNNLRNDRPNIVLTHQTPYEYYEDAVFDKYRVVDNKLADAGFMNQTFKGIPMTWSPKCASTRMYFLNTKFIKLVIDPMMNFDMTEWKAIPDQPNDRAAQIVTACQLITSRRRVHAVLRGIDTA